MKTMGRTILAIAALAGGAALAQGDQTTVVVSQPETSITEAKPYSVSLQGGVEGYSGALASRIDPGATYGLSIGWDPVRFLGAELGYSGAMHELRSRTTGGLTASSGPDLLRNGAYLALKPGFTVPLGFAESASIRPYVLGGIGADWYKPRGTTRDFGFNTETVASVPFGAGVQARMGSFLADARFNYNYEFVNQFAARDANPLRYQGQLRVGAAF